VRTGYGAKLEKSSAEMLARAMVLDDVTAAAKWILEA